MNDWLDALRKTGLFLFERESVSEMWGVVVLCLFFVFWVYGKISAGFSSQGGRSFLTVIPGIFVLVLASVAVRVYLTNDWLIQWVAVLLAFLLVVLPLTKAVEKTSYFNAMLVWGVCALVVGVILLMEPLVVQSFQRGIKKGSLMKDQHEIENEIMQQVDK